MWDDPIIAETRQARDQIASRFDYEIEAIGEYFKTKRASDARALIENAVSQAQVSSTLPAVAKPRRKKRSTQAKGKATYLKSERDLS